MNLKGYLFKYDLNVKAFASRVRISPSYCYNILRGIRRPSPELAQRIERETQGKVLAKDLLFPSAGEEYELEEEKIQKRINQIENRLYRLEEDYYGVKNEESLEEGEIPVPPKMC